MPTELLPDAEQFLRLQDIVLHKYPALALNGERGQTPDTYYEQFKRSF